MAQGKYSSYPPKRRRRRRRNPAGPIIVILLLIALLAILGTFMLRSCQAEPEAPETQPSQEAAAPETTEATEPVTAPPTAAPTEEIAPETTEATAAPTTEPTTEPTEETTQETTEATTEPTTEPTKAPTEEEKDKGKQIAELAKAQIGKSYELGGDGPDTFDTSGFVKYCVKEITGTSLPHSVSKQAKKGDRIEKKDLLPGDAVFFWTSDPEAVEYVGIYIGGGKFVAARNPEKPVSELNLKTDYFSERYLFACRYW